MLFQDLGLVPDISHAAFLRQLELTNQERGQAVKQGKVVYGPVRYTRLQFYGHWKATLRIQATEKLAQTQWHPAEGNLQKFYDDNRDLFRVPPSYTLELITVQTRRQAPAGDKKASIQPTARRILSQLKTGKALSELLKDQTGSDDAKVSGQRLENMNPDRMSELFPDEQQLQTVLALAPGETALLADSDTQAKLVRCLGKAPGGYRPFETVQPQVKEGWLRERYDQHIKDLAARAQIGINQEVIDTYWKTPS